MHVDMVKSRKAEVKLVEEKNSLKSPALSSEKVGQNYRCI